MKVKLINEAKVLMQAGETVDVSPVVARQLISLGKAVEVKVQPKKKKED